MSNVANLPATAEQPPRLPSVSAGARPQAIVPTDFEGAWRIANAVVKAGMAPAGLDTAEKAMVAVMHGLEVGMTPMTALQSIAVVNGRPAIWGDGAIGLVRASGLCEFVTEVVTGTGDERVATCTVKRKGEPQPQTRRFSVADAKQANLWSKAGPWKQYPERMLQLRARAFALRDVFADVLRGLHIAEEAQDVPVARDITPPVPPSPPSPPSPPPARVPYVPSSPVVRELVASHPDAPLEVAGPGSDWFESLEEALRQAPDAESIAELWANMDVEQVCSDPSDRQIAVAIRRRVQPDWAGEED